MLGQRLPSRILGVPGAAAGAASANGVEQQPKPYAPASSSPFLTPESECAPPLVPETAGEVPPAVPRLLADLHATHAALLAAAQQAAHALALPVTPPAAAGQAVEGHVSDAQLAALSRLRSAVAATQAHASAFLPAPTAVAPLDPPVPASALTPHVIHAAGERLRTLCASEASGSLDDDDDFEPLPPPASDAQTNDPQARVDPAVASLLSLSFPSYPQKPDSTGADLSNRWPRPHYHLLDQAPEPSEGAALPDAAAATDVRSSAVSDTSSDEYASDGDRSGGNHKKRKSLRYRRGEDIDSRHWCGMLNATGSTEGVRGIPPQSRIHQEGECACSCSHAAAAWTYPFPPHRLTARWVRSAMRVPWTSHRLAKRYYNYCDARLATQHDPSGPTADASRFTGFVNLARTAENPIRYPRIQFFHPGGKNDGGKGLQVTIAPPDEGEHWVDPREIRLPGLSTPRLPLPVQGAGGKKKKVSKAEKVKAHVLATKSHKGQRRPTLAELRARVAGKKPDLTASPAGTVLSPEPAKEPTPEPVNTFCWPPKGVVLPAFPPCLPSPAAPPPSPPNLPLFWLYAAPRAKLSTFSFTSARRCPVQLLPLPVFVPPPNLPRPRITAPLPMPTTLNIPADVRPGPSYHDQGLGPQLRKLRSTLQVIIPSLIETEKGMEAAAEATLTPNTPERLVCALLDGMAITQTAVPSRLVADLDALRSLHRPSSPMEMKMTKVKVKTDKVGNPDGESGGTTGRVRLVTAPEAVLMELQGAQDEVASSAGLPTVVEKAAPGTTPPPACKFKPGTAPQGLAPAASTKTFPPLFPSLEDDSLSESSIPPALLSMYRKMYEAAYEFFDRAEWDGLVALTARAEGTDPLLSMIPQIPAKSTNEELSGWIYGTAYEFFDHNEWDEWIKHLRLMSEWGEDPIAYMKRQLTPPKDIASAWELQRQGARLKLFSLARQALRIESCPVPVKGTRDSNASPERSRSKGKNAANGAVTAAAPAAAADLAELSTAGPGIQAFLKLPAARKLLPQDRAPTTQELLDACQVLTKRLETDGLAMIQSVEAGSDAAASPTQPGPVAAESAPAVEEKKKSAKGSRRKKTVANNIHHRSNWTAGREAAGAAAGHAGTGGVSGHTLSSVDNSHGIPAGCLDHPTTSTALFGDEWVCLMCDYELLYGEKPRMLAAVKRRSRLEETRLWARERAHRLAAGERPEPPPVCTCGRAHHHHLPSSS